VVNDLGLEGLNSMDRGLGKRKQTGDPKAAHKAGKAPEKCTIGKLPFY